MTVQPLCRNATSRLLQLRRSPESLTFWTCCCPKFYQMEAGMLKHGTAHALTGWFDRLHGHHSADGTWKTCTQQLSQVICKTRQGCSEISAAARGIGAKTVDTQRNQQCQKRSHTCHNCRKGFSPLLPSSTMVLRSQYQETMTLLCACIHLVKRAMHR